jgi:hypothetical protein
MVDSDLDKEYNVAIDIEGSVEDMAAKGDGIPTGAKEGPNSTP